MTYATGKNRDDETALDQVERNMSPEDKAMARDLNVPLESLSFKLARARELYLESAAFARVESGATQTDHPA